MQTPPKPIQLALEATAIICRERPIKQTDPEDRTKHTYSYFLAAKKMMQKANFIKRLKKYDKETIT